MAKKTLKATNSLNRMQILNCLKNELRGAVTADCISAYSAEHLEPYKELDRAIVEAIKAEAKFLAECDDWPL